MIQSVEANEQRRSLESLQSMQSDTGTLRSHCGSESGTLKSNAPSVRYVADVTCTMETINESYDPDQDLDQDYAKIDDKATDYQIMWTQLMIGQTVLGKGVFGDVKEGVVFKKDNKTVKVAVRTWKGKFL